MAGIGLYGVFYSKATLDSNGVLASYTGVKQMGKAISANFEQGETDDNPLYANNSAAERDQQSGVGGTLTMVLDKLTGDAYEDLYGYDEESASVTIGTETVTGTGYDDTGDETSAPVGVAYIEWDQENQSRDIHRAVIYSLARFAQPTGERTTLEPGQPVSWQTPEIVGTVSGISETGAKPWRKRYTFPSQAAAIQFITDYFAAPTPSPGDG